jgi:predicted DNA-binding protein
MRGTFMTQRLPEKLLVRLPEGMRERLRALAEPQCLYPADLVRRALLHVIEEEEAKLARKSDPTA